jgi:hypothetical protein
MLADLQLAPLPEPMHALLIHQPASTQECTDAPVTIPRVARGKGLHMLLQVHVPIRAGLILQRRALELQ